MGFPRSSSILTPGRRCFIGVRTNWSAVVADGTHSRMSLTPVPDRTTKLLAIPCPPCDKHSRVRGLVRPSACSTRTGARFIRREGRPSGCPLSLCRHRGAALSLRRGYLTPRPAPSRPAQVFRLGRGFCCARLRSAPQLPSGPISCCSVAPCTLACSRSASRDLIVPVNPSGVGPHDCQANKRYRRDR
jgi:hypothetical protein